MQAQATAQSFAETFIAMSERQGEGVTARAGTDSATGMSTLDVTTHVPLGEGLTGSGGEYIFKAQFEKVIDQPVNPATVSKVSVTTRVRTDANDLTAGYDQYSLELVKQGEDWFFQVTTGEVNGPQKFARSDTTMLGAEEDSKRNALVGQAFDVVSAAQAHQPLAPIFDIAS